MVVFSLVFALTVVVEPGVAQACSCFVSAWEILSHTSKDRVHTARLSAEHNGLKASVHRGSTPSQRAYNAFGTNHVGIHHTLSQRPDSTLR